jgi:hypothetical protein
METRGSISIIAEPAGLYTIEVEDYLTGDIETEEHLAPLELIGALRKRGVEPEMIAEVERDIADLGNRSS